jgi:hypothetical protein
LVDTGVYLELGRLDSATELLELDDPVFGGARLAFVAPAVCQHDEAVAIGGFLERALASDGCHIVTFLDRVQEDVLNVAVEGIDAIDVDHEVGAAKFPEKAGHDESEFVFRFQLTFVLDASLLGPRREKKRKCDDGDDKGRGEPEDRPDDLGEPLAGGKPDDHLGTGSAAPSGTR